MSGMIRLRPTQILLTSEEVSRALRKFHPADAGSLSSSATLPWNHNITVRRNRNTKEVDKIAQNFIIHEDLPRSNRDIEGGGADTGEISDMSDFNFGPILLRRSLSGANTLFAEANSSSEAGDEGNDDEQSTGSTWNEEHSVTTLINENPADNLISSKLVDGSMSSADEQQSLNWEASSDDLVKNETNNGQGESFIDIEYMADVELSIPEDSSSSIQDSDLETGLQESYSLPMDGANEESISRRFEDMNLYASPVPRYDETFRSQEFPLNRTPGTPGTPTGVSLPPTPPSVRRLFEEVSPRLAEVAGLSPRHVAVSRARFARYRSRSLQYSALAGQAADLQTEGDYRQRSHTAGTSQQWLLNSSPPLAHVKRRVITIGARSMTDELYDTNTDDSDGGIGIVEQTSETEALIGKKREDLDNRREDAARRLFD